MRPLRLEVGLAEGALKARLSGVAGAASEVDEIAAEQAFDVAAAEALAATIGSILNRATRWGDADQGSRELLRQHGELLFDTVLPAPIKAALRAVVSETIGRALVLVLEPTLLGLPWELMHTGRAFLGLELAIGRIVRGVQAEVSVHDVAQAPLRTLIVCDPRGDLIGSYYEGLTLRDGLARHEARFAVDLRSSEVSRAEVRRLLREYDVIHFAGHAEREADDAAGDAADDAASGARERGWWLSDGVLGPSAIRELAGGRAFPRLIFSNACRSAGEGAALADASPGLAAAFLDAGVEHYVGTVHDVPDEPASLFALTFYEVLVSRPDAGFGEAAREARVRLATRYGPSSVYWASWVLYGSPAAAGFAQVAVAPADRGGREVAEGVGLPALGARVRGAAVEAAPAIALETSGWRLMARGATIAFSLFGFMAAMVMLATVIGRDPPVPWMEARAMPRIELPSRVVLEKAPHSVRFAVPEAGYVALWRVQGGGPIERVDAAQGPLRAVAAGELVEVPVSTEGPASDGSERFYLAWRQAPPSDPRSFEAELAAEVSALGAPDTTRARFKEALDDRFDSVTELVVGP